MPSDDLDERIARIHQLIDAMRSVSADAREEALVATEQLLTQARSNHLAAISQTRHVLDALRSDRSKRRR